MIQKLVEVGEFHVKYCLNSELIKILKKIYCNFDASHDIKR